MVVNNKQFGSKTKSKYTVINIEKYIGNPDNVIIRSSWERDAFTFCDNNPNILRWCSEEIVIPYILPLPNGGVRPAKYYPDLYVEYKDVNGKLNRELIEIKPKKQTRPSRARNPKTKMFENAAFMKNTLKWEAAHAWCKERGIEFKILHEGDQFK